MPVGQRISAFLAAIGPYKELALLAMGLVAAVSGSVSWAAAHFATQAQVLYLECRVNHNVETLQLPIKNAAFSASLEWRTSQIRQLSRQATPETGVIIAQLASEIDDLQKRQVTMAEEVKKRLDEMAKNCQKEITTQEAMKK
jgi:hypothetical protein